MALENPDDCLLADRKHLSVKDRIEGFISQAKLFLNEKSDTTCAIANLNVAFILANDSSLFREKTNILILIGDTYYQVGDFDKAYQKYTAGMKIAESNNYSREFGLCLKGISHINWRNGDYINSISHILRSIEKFEELDDTLEIISATNILAGIYMSQGKLDQAENLYNSMFQLALSIGDSTQIAENYKYKGVVQFFKKNYQSAIDNYMLALEINLNLGEELNGSINLGNIGEAHHLLGNYESALSNYITALTIQNKYKFNSGLIFIHYSMGNSYTSLGELQKGMRHFKKSLELMELTGEKREMNLVYQFIAKNYVLQGNYKNAYAYQLLYSQERDSVMNLEVTKQFEEIRAKYEFDKKERENVILLQENQLRKIEIQTNNKIISLQYIVGILLLTFLFIATFFSIKLFSQKKKINAANRTKDKLFNIIGHDLKGPVGNLKAIVDMIIIDKRLNADKQFIKVLSSLKKSIHAAYFLLIDLLSWSVMQKDGIILDPKTLDMKELVIQNIDLLEYQTKEKGIIIENNIQDNCNTIADESTVLTVIRNLVSNAIKFTPKGGKIIIESKFEENLIDKSSQMWQFSVIDTGVGIPTEKMNSLFNFAQMESTYGTDNEKGTGLGLSICKEFIEKNNGKIGVSSEVEKGSVFYFSLPASTNFI